MRHLKSFSLLLISAGLVACTGGTAGVDEGTSEVGYADFNLELDDGGFTGESDEAPAFGEIDLSVDPVSDAESDPVAEEAIEALGPAAGLDVYTIRLAWGRPHLTEGMPATSWDGAISTSRGALRVRRLIRFEPATDHLLPRTSAQSVEFQSTTRPHNDGLLLTLVVPRAADAAVPGELSIALGDLVDVTIPHEKLAHLLRARKVDDFGNGVTIAAFRRDGCENGGIHGLWKRVNAKGGVYRGIVTDGDGEVRGRLAGLWGTRKDGTRRFFGLYVRDGKPAGVVRGAWRPVPGMDAVLFRGHWIGAKGEHRGVLQGLARTGDAKGAGDFIGAWTDQSCGQDGGMTVATPETAPADLCSSDAVCVAEPAVECSAADCAATTDE